MLLSSSNSNSRSVVYLVRQDWPVIDSMAYDKLYVTDEFPVLVNPVFSYSSSPISYFKWSIGDTIYSNSHLGKLIIYLQVNTL